MNQTEQVESIYVLRASRENLPVKRLRIGQSAVLMVSEC
jgi:hypothetical protein